MKTVLGVVLVIVLSIGAMYYFSNAEVTVVPNTVGAAVQSSFTGGQAAEDIPFQVITSQKVASQSVPGSGTKTVSQSASGSITVYNTQSKAQPLITNTRFATASGLIFRIHKAITVPAGTSAKPGSISVTVYADAPGDTYNVAATSFTVPGLAGTPQESMVYARSSSAMTGGASGTIPVVDPTTEATTRTALMNALTPELTASLAAQVPAGYILLAGAATTSFQELTPSTSATAGQVDIKEQGTITAVVFPNPALSKAIATSVAGLNYQGEPLTLATSSTLQLSAATFPGSGDQTFSFTLSGTASFIYTVDPTRIAAAVAGKSRADAEIVLGNYPEVKQATIVLRPFWKQNFPQDPSAIMVTSTNP